MIHEITLKKIEVTDFRIIFRLLGMLVIYKSLDQLGMAFCNWCCVWVCNAWF